MKILSYNLLKHRASSELQELAEINQLDALCLQEINVGDAPKRLGELELIIGTEKNRLGLAIYLNTQKYDAVASMSYKLRDATYDKLAKPAHERLLGVVARNSDTREQFTVGSFHASPLTALNKIRRTQIHDGLSKLDTLGNSSPMVMLGDYNYPLFRKRLETEIHSMGYNVKFSDSHTYKNYGVRGHFDFVVSKNFTVSALTTLRRGRSDHLPILAKLELGI